MYASESLFLSVMGTNLSSFQIFSEWFAGIMNSQCDLCVLQLQLNFTSRS